MDGVKSLLEKMWVGKRFVYVSKYGSETIGEVESVRIGIEMTFDSDSNTVIKNLVDKKYKNLLNMRNRPNISIFSTKGQMYELNEIYILND